MPVDELYLHELTTRINQSISRIANLGHDDSKRTGATSNAAAMVNAASVEGFLPVALQSMADTRIPESLIESLALKFILHQGAATGHAVAKQLRLRFDILHKMLARLKTEQKVIHRGAGKLGDYVYELTEKGTEAALLLHAKRKLFWRAPVHFDDYVAAVKTQGVHGQRISREAVLRAYRPLDLDESLLNRIGQALDAGKGFFLYGMPGNGRLPSPSSYRRSTASTSGFPVLCTSRGTSYICSILVCMWRRRWRIIARIRSTIVGYAFVAQPSSSAASSR